MSLYTMLKKILNKLNQQSKGKKNSKKTLPKALPKNIIFQNSARMQGPPPLDRIHKIVKWFYSRNISKLQNVA
jgi:hypothetical protein